MAEMIKYPLAYNPILEYWEEIEKGNINVGDKIRRTYKKVVKDIKYPGEYFYSPKRGNHILEFAENFCRHSKGKCGGKRVKLELWEKHIWQQYLALSISREIVNTENRSSL